MRPGTKVKLWSPKFTNRPDVEPPALLKLTGAVSIFSAVGVLIYAIAMALAYGEPAGPDAIYIAVLHFILPICVFYTINVNSPLSRFAIGFYAVTLGLATILGRGFLGNLQIPETTRIVASVAVLATIIYWLFGSPKMRFYYATIANRPIADELRARADELQGGLSLSPRVRTVVEWIIDRAETAVLLGFIAVVFYAYWSTG